MSLSWLLAKRDCGNGQGEGEKNLSALLPADRPFLSATGRSMKTREPTSSSFGAESCNSQIGKTKVDICINFPADMWEKVVSSFGMSVNAIFLAWILRLLGHCAFVSPFHPYKLCRDVGRLSKCAIKNGPVVTLCSPSPVTAPGLGCSCNPAGPAFVLGLPEQVCAPSARPKNLSDKGGVERFLNFFKLLLPDLFSCL